MCPPLRPQNQYLYFIFDLIWFLIIVLAVLADSLLHEVFQERAHDESRSCQAVLGVDFVGFPVSGDGLLGASWGSLVGVFWEEGRLGSSSPSS